MAKTNYINSIALNYMHPSLLHQYPLDAYNIYIEANQNTGELLIINVLVAQTMSFQLLNISIHDYYNLRMFCKTPLLII